MLPVVGILGLKARDIVGYSMPQFAVHVPLVLFLVWILNYTLTYVPPVISEAARHRSRFRLLASQFVFRFESAQSDRLFPASCLRTPNTEYEHSTEHEHEPRSEHQEA